MAYLSNPTRYMNYSGNINFDIHSLIPADWISKPIPETTNQKKNSPNPYSQEVQFLPQSSILRKKITLETYTVVNPTESLIPS